MHVFVNECIGVGTCVCMCVERGGGEEEAQQDSVSSQPRTRTFAPASGFLDLQNDCRYKDGSNNDTSDHAAIPTRLVLGFGQGRCGRLGRRHCRSILRSCQDCCACVWVCVSWEFCCTHPWGCGAFFVFAWLPPWPRDDGKKQIPDPVCFALGVYSENSCTKNKQRTGAKRLPTVTGQFPQPV